MGHLRQSIHWLCCTTLVLTGVLGRGFVLCIDGGSVRLEASALDGSCNQGRGKLSDHATPDSSLSRTGCEPGTACEPSVSYKPSVGYEPSVGFEPCDGCEDVKVLEGTAPLPAGSETSLLPGPPLLLDFVALGAASSLQSAGLVPRLRPSLLDPPSFDLYAVRKSVVLLI